MDKQIDNVWKTQETNVWVTENFLKTTSQNDFTVRVCHYTALDWPTANNDDNAKIGVVTVVLWFSQS